MRTYKKYVLVAIQILINAKVFAVPVTNPVSVSCPRTFSCEWVTYPDAQDKGPWYRCTLDGPNGKYFQPIHSKQAFDGSKLRLVQTYIHKQINGTPRFGVATCEFKNRIDNTLPNRTSWESSREWAFERGNTINSTWFYTEGSLYTSCGAGDQCDMQVMPSKDWTPKGWCDL